MLKLQPPLPSGPGINEVGVEVLGVGTPARATFQADRRGLHGNPRNQNVGCSRLLPWTGKGEERYGYKNKSHPEGARAGIGDVRGP